MSILVCLWKYKANHQKKLIKVNLLNEKPDPTEEMIELDEIKNHFEKDLKLEILPSCEFAEEQIITPITPLTPREIFFHDLIESAKEVELNSSTQLPRTSAVIDNDKEFFIANVSPNKNCVSNVFLYVNETDTVANDNSELHFVVNDK